MKKLFVRWAIKLLKKNVKSSMTYAELESWGVQDIFEVNGGGKGYVL